MSRLSRIALLASIGVAGLLLAVVAAVLLLFDPNAYKTRVEASVSKAAGMDVRIGGRLKIRLFPRVALTVEDVHFRSRASEVAAVQEAEFAVDLRAALSKEIRLKSLTLRQPVITIERDTDGRFNFEGPRGATGSLPTLDLPRVSISDGSLAYLDKRFGKAFEGRGCNLDLQDLQLSGGERSKWIEGISFTAQAGCGEIRKDSLVVSDLKFSAVMKAAVLDLKPVAARIFETQGLGSLHADFSGATALYRMDYTLPQFPVQALFKTLSDNQVATGRMNFSARLATQGSTVKALRQNLKGQISLRGKNLTLNGSDLDEAFKRFESSQNFNLVDAGAFFFAGPIGLMVTKGYNFASLAQTRGGSSEIRMLVSDWKVERGQAQAHDVAMATKENRVALQGRLDFVNDQFDEVTIALIDAKGCAKVQQKISGPFEDPAVQKPDLVKALAGPALRLLKKGSDLLTGGGRCDVFYAGSVAGPQ